MLVNLTNLRLVDCWFVSYDSCGDIMQLENRSVFEYLLQIQSLVDFVGSIGVIISSDKHLDAILKGLTREYESTMSLICIKFEPFSIDGLKLYS